MAEGLKFSCVRAWVLFSGHSRREDVQAFFGLVSLLSVACDFDDARLTNQCFSTNNV